MISKRAAALVPYLAGEQPKDKKFIKLNTNENPFPPSERVEKALREIDADKLKLYPDPDSYELKEILAKKENVKPENIFVGNGSDEILAFAFYALFDENIAFADITYSFYPVYCSLFNLSYKTLPLNEKFEFESADYINQNYGGIVIANPNAPTSVLAKREFLEKVVSSNKCNVLLDEAYIDFAPINCSAVDLCAKYPNLLVVKTFSKSYSLAGIRCGYAVGNKELIDALNRVKDSFNSYPLDYVCQKICAAAIEDDIYHNECCARIIKIRENTVKTLRKTGYEVLDSAANFIFVKSPGAGKEMYEFLRNGGVLVRYWNKPRIDKFLRVSIGSEKEMEEFVSLCEKYKGMSQNNI